ncbi:MAG: hypothetical protein PHV60_04855 [bacterium]|nr:hypothetical protein [bacterium]
MYLYCGANPENWVDPFGNVSLSYNAGYHIPITPGPVSVGQNFSSSTKLRSIWDIGNTPQAEPTQPEAVIGSFVDVGVSLGLSDFDNTGCDGVTISIGSGRYGGIQFTLKETFDQNKSILNPFRYLNGVSVGLGLGYGSPVQVTVPLKR